MNEITFNPFEDRLSRDLRNNLSEAFAHAIETGSSEPLLTMVTEFRNMQTPPFYQEYLEDRFTRYQMALETIGHGITDPISRGLILWDLRLFFEFHEVLEHTWYSATGPMKMTLQALIRAAGVYIKQEYGFHDSAARIAAKAIPVLLENKHLLAPYFKVEKLTTALAEPRQPPPKLQEST